MTKIIAEIRTPKQRMTRLFGCILRQDDTNEYSTHRSYYDNHGVITDTSEGHYNLTLEQAWEDFKERTTKALSYGVGTFESA